MVIYLEYEGIKGNVTAKGHVIIGVGRLIRDLAVILKLNLVVGKQE